MSAAAAYLLHVSDTLAPALAGHAGASYDSPVAHPEADAFALARFLLASPVLPDDPGPWHRAIPGGRRTVWLEPAGEAG
ncbi:MAG TPA: hypothetical protein VG275_01920 [Solirubrobacteraceae bacterium]|jgi:hypothetical protein|nr:hypothetical protein [Solirubrobacteraceae bacterium]